MRKVKEILTQAGQLVKKSLDKTLSIIHKVTSKLTSQRLIISILILSLILNPYLIPTSIISLALGHELAQSNQKTKQLNTQTA